MGTIEISVFALRLAALYVWIQTILQVGYLPIIGSMSDANLGRASSIGYAISVGLHALLGTALWFGSRPLARRVLGESSAQHQPPTAAIAGLGFVLAGILVLDVALQQIWAVVFASTLPSAIGGGSSRFWAPCASLAMLSILGVALVVGGRKIAMRMFPSGDPSRPLALEIQAVALSVLGIVIAASALPSALSIAAAAGWLRGDDFDAEAQADLLLQIAVELLRLAIGVGLFLGGGALSRVWRWTQTAGLNASNSPPR